MMGDTIRAEIRKIRTTRSALGLLVGAASGAGTVAMIVLLAFVAYLLWPLRAHVRDLCADLAPGVRLINDLIGFADEDFEHFFRTLAETQLTPIQARPLDHARLQRSPTAVPPAQVVRHAPQRTQNPACRTPS